MIDLMIEREEQTPMKPKNTVCLWFDSTPS